MLFGSGGFFIEKAVKLRPELKLHLLADSTSLVRALEEYRADHGTYPAGCDRETLRHAIEPDYFRRAPMRGVGYCSEGAHYLLVKRALIDDGPGAIAPLEIRNGTIVAWPYQLDEQSIRRTQETLLESKRAADETREQAGRSSAGQSFSNEQPNTR